MTRHDLKPKKRNIVRKGKFIVYIVECLDGMYYTGYTNNLEKRVERHNQGHASRYTRGRLPVRVVWNKQYCYFKKAFLMEKKIKYLTRNQKEALVKGKRLDKVLADAGKLREL